MEYDELVEKFTLLQEAFREHRHTGSDSHTLQIISNEGTITSQDSSSISDDTYSSTEADVIRNNRTRIQEIEDALIANGILSS